MSPRPSRNAVLDADAAAPAGPVAATLSSGLGATSLPSQIHEILEEAIIEGVLRPGERLRADDLAARYGVSRIPVREALRSLEAAGWVEIRPRYGVYVALRSDEELRDLFDVRTVLEAHAAERAARQRTEQDLQALRRAVTASREAVDRDDDSELTRRSAAFYEALHRAAHNTVLAATLAGLGKRARFYFATVVHDLGREWVGVHERLLEAVEAGDAQRAGAVSAEHIADTGRAVHRLLAQETAAAG